MRITGLRRKILSLVTAGTLLFSSAASAAPASPPAPKSTQAVQQLINQQFKQKFTWDSVQGSLAEGRVILIGHSGSAAGISITIECTITTNPFTIRCTITINSSNA